MTIDGHTEVQAEIRRIRVHAFVQFGNPDPPSLHEQIAGIESLPKPPAGLSHSFSRLLESVGTHRAVYWQSSGGVRVASMACERFRLRHGRWPKALSGWFPSSCRNFHSIPSMVSPCVMCSRRWVVITRSVKIDRNWEAIARGCPTCRNRLALEHRQAAAASHR